MYIYFSYYFYYSFSDANQLLLFLLQPWWNSNIHSPMISSEKKWAFFFCCPISRQLRAEKLFFGYLNKWTGHTLISRFKCEIIGIKDWLSRAHPRTLEFCAPVKKMTGNYSSPSKYYFDRKDISSRTSCHLQHNCWIYSHQTPMIHTLVEPHPVVQEGQPVADLLLLLSIVVGQFHLTHSQISPMWSDQFLVKDHFLSLTRMHCLPRRLYSGREKGSCAYSAVEFPRLSPRKGSL